MYVAETTIVSTSHVTTSNLFKNIFDIQNYKQFIFTVQMQREMEISPQL